MIKLFLSILLLIALFNGCSKQGHDAHEKESTLHQGHEMHHEENKTSAEIKQTYDSAELKIGDNTICPVMCTKFTVQEDTLKVTVKNKNYYVCCPACIDMLKNDPDKYLK